MAVGGWVLTDRHDLAPCAANSLHRVITSVNDVIGQGRAKLTKVHVLPSVARMPPRSHTNQTSQGLDPNLYTRIDTIAPTPHANFGRGQLFPFIANPFITLGH